MEGDNSYTVKDIPGASQLYKKSSISKEAFDKLIHNLVIGITEKASKGYYQYTYYLPIPVGFKQRIYGIFINKGYKVEFSKPQKTKDKSPSGWDLEVVEITLDWSTKLI